MTELDDLRSHDPVTRASAAVTLGLKGDLPRGAPPALDDLARLDADPRVRAGARRGGGPRSTPKPTYAGAPPSSRPSCAAPRRWQR
jgi:hypothetical protein